MQIDLSTVLAMISTIASLAFGAWLTTAKYALSQREAEINRRMNLLDADVKGIDARLHTEEKATIRQDGDLQRAIDTHKNVAEDVLEIKRTMITKAEWVHFERAIAQQISLMGRSSGGIPRPEYTPRATPGSYQLQNPISASPPPPPLKRDKDRR
jgi:hypothetical protein